MKSEAFDGEAVMLTARGSRKQILKESQRLSRKNLSICLVSTNTRPWKQDDGSSEAQCQNINNKCLIKGLNIKVTMLFHVRSVVQGLRWHDVDDDAAAETNQEMFGPRRMGFPSLRVQPIRLAWA